MAEGIRAWLGDLAAVVVAHHIPVKSMKLAPEMIADVSAELLRQSDWDEGSKIQYLGWLTRPGIRAEGSVLIEFTSPVMANRAIITGVVWGSKSTMPRASAARAG